MPTGGGKSLEDLVQVGEGLEDDQIGASFGKKLKAAFDTHVTEAKKVLWPGRQLAVLSLGLVLHLVVYQLGNWQVALMLLGVCVIQAWSFTIVSRARQRNNQQYLAWASVFSNGVWYICMHYLAMGKITLEKAVARDLLVESGNFLLMLVGWGLVIDTTGAGKGLSWLGFLLGPLGGRDGAWAYANLGVPVPPGFGFMNRGYMHAVRHDVFAVGDGAEDRAFVASLAYALHGRRLAAEAAGSANLPHYPGSGHDLGALGYSANASLSSALGATSAGKANRRSDTAMQPEPVPTSAKRALEAV